MGAVARRNLEERGDGAAERQNQREGEECTIDDVTIYPCRGVGSWLTPDLYQAEH
jgi:hypothetical protein